MCLRGLLLLGIDCANFARRWGGRSGCRLINADWSGAKCKNHDSSFRCFGCEVRTQINKFGLDPGAKCEMLVKSPDELSVRKFEMRICLLSRRVN